MWLGSFAFNRSIGTRISRFKINYTISKVEWFEIDAWRMCLDNTFFEPCFILIWLTHLVPEAPHTDFSASPLMIWRPIWYLILSIYTWLSQIKHGKHEAEFSLDWTFSKTDVWLSIDFKSKNLMKFHQMLLFGSPMIHWMMYFLLRRLVVYVSDEAFEDVSSEEIYIVLALLLFKKDKIFRLALSTFFRIFVDALLF